MIFAGFFFGTVLAGFNTDGLVESVFEMPDFKRAALFLCMRCFLTALSSKEKAPDTSFLLFDFLALRTAFSMREINASFSFSRFLSLRNFLIADFITGMVFVRNASYILNRHRIKNL